MFGTALMVETSCMGMLGTTNEWIGIVICTLIAMAFGAIIGMGNAVMVVRFNMPSFIATVAIQYVLNGLKMVITSGAYVYPLPNSLIKFVKLGIAMPRGKIAVSFIILMILLVIAHIILTYTTYGRSVYATGSNRIMAQLSGVKTNRVRYTYYMVLHSLVALVGILNAGYLKQGFPGIGTNWHLTIMAACAIGGIKFSGSSGNMMGLLIGLILMLIVVSDRVRSNRKVRA